MNNDHVLTAGDAARICAFIGAFFISTCQLSFAAAADLSIDAPITKVTVYQQGAMVTRSGIVEIPVGAHRLVFDGLPANIDPSLLRVTVNSKAVKLGSIDSEKLTQLDFVDIQEKKLRREIETLDDQKAAIDDEIHTAEAQLRLLDTVSFGQPHDGAKASVDVQSLQSVVSTIGSSGTAARTHIREAIIRKRDVDRNIAKLNEDLRKVSTNRKDNLQVRATIEADTAVSAPVSIIYGVNDARWLWNYEAHLDSETKQVSLIKQAQIRQGSGEDWTNVELTLSSSSPSGKNSLAPLKSLLVKAEEPGTSHGRSAPGADSNLSEIVVTARRKESPFGHRESTSAEEPGSYVEMDTNATEFLTEYLVPGHVTITANREPRMFPVSQDEFAVELVARTIPKRERQAYLEASFKYDRSSPLQAGELQLFRDDAYIGKAAINTFLPGADVRLPFGVDERIRVVVRQEPEQSGERGVFGRQKLKDERLRFEISNYHSSSIHVEVLDRIPIAKDSDVHIEVPAGSTPPTQRDYENKPGILLWSLDVEPRQTATVRHYVEIRYPSDKQLAGFEADE